MKTLPLVFGTLAAAVLLGWASGALAATTACGPAVGVTCSPAADVSSTFLVDVPACVPAPPANFDLRLPGAGAAAPGDTALCTQTVAGNPSHYQCVPGANVKTKASGLLQSAAQVCGMTFVVPIAPAAAPATDALETTSTAPSLSHLPAVEWQKALAEIGVPIAGKRVGNYYDRYRDVAVLFFDASGVAFYPMLDVVDEDDDIYVVVADYESRMLGVKVDIQGCNRPPIEPRVYNPKPSEGTKTRPSEPVRFLVRAIGKCAGADSGGPQVVIANGGQQRVQTIPVNPLYRFAVGVAAAYDGTNRRELGLRTLPGETVPRIAQTQEALGLTSLLYVSFYPWARDFRKTDAFLAQRLQLFVGLDPRKLDEHLVVGVGYELTMGLNALVGWRVLTRQPVLAEGSGLSKGNTFDGDSRDIPTRKRWEVGGPFVGVGLSSALLARLK
ncbi:MAG: hypothetical protein ABUL60_31595 [Myxococcales bacterium]